MSFAPVLREGAAPHALVVATHPAAASLTRSVAEAVARALAAHGHTTEVADLVAEGFDPVFGRADHAAYSGVGPLPDDARAEQRRIDRADRLVLVYPVYWWGLPALLKGWIDRVFVAGWAFEENAGGGIVKRLGRLKVHLVALGGADGATYDRHGYRHAMHAQIEHGIFEFCGAAVATSELVTADRLGTPSLLEDTVRTITNSLPRQDASHVSVNGEVTDGRDDV